MVRVPTSSCCCWLRRQGRLAALPRADDAGGAGTFEVQGLFYAVAARAAHAQSTGRGLFTGFVYEFLPRIGTSKKVGKDGSERASCRRAYLGRVWHGGDFDSIGPPFAMSSLSDTIRVKL